MSKSLLTILLFFISVDTFSQSPVVFINAGSRAPYGSNQELTINSNGQCRYYLKEVNGPVKDSASFAISLVQLDSLFKKADQTGFFGLGLSYPGKHVDGGGIYISMNYSGRKKRVDIRNTDLPQINDLMVWINSLLAPRGIVIKYSQSK